MKQLEIINKALSLFENSFINQNNELIMIPKFNVYTLLDDIETETDFKIKLCEWFSRDCCCALRYSQNKRLNKYYQENTEIFNNLCGTYFDVAVMQLIYVVLGNGINHTLSKEFVCSGFDLKTLTKED